MAKLSMNLFQINAIFAEFGCVGMLDALKVEFLVVKLSLDNHRRVCHHARWYTIRNGGCIGFAHHDVNNLLQYRL